MTAAKAWCPPLPIVGVGDSVAGAFSAALASATVANGVATLRFSGLEISNRTVAGLVTGGRAAAVAKICCDSTYFRTTEVIAVPVAEVTLPATQVIDEVLATLRIVSQARIEGYRPDGLHDDYEDAVFTVEPGDILAEGAEFRFPIDSTFDPLKAPVSSIMRVRKVEDRFDGYRVNFDSNRIVIEFGEAEWRKYQRLKNSTAPAVIHASVVLPVLTEALLIVKSQDPNYEGELWFRRLQAMIEGRPGINSARPAAELAQLLLKGPFARTASQLLTEDGDN